MAAYKPVARGWRWFVRQVEAGLEFPPERGFRYVYSARFKAQAAILVVGFALLVVTFAVIAGVVYVVG